MTEQNELFISVACERNKLFIKYGRTTRHGGEQVHKSVVILDSLL